MRISKFGIDTIIMFEGVRLKSYTDVNDIWTIGVGHTGLVNNQRIQSDTTITMDIANQLLRFDLQLVENTINKLVKVKLNQNQFDALCSLVFNIGVGSFSRSNLLRKINKQLFLEAADEFLLWRNSKGENKYLLKRREEERKIFLS